MIHVDCGVTGGLGPLDGVLLPPTYLGRLLLLARPWPPRQACREKRRKPLNGRPRPPRRQPREQQGCCSPVPLRPHFCLLRAAGATPGGSSLTFGRCLPVYPERAHGPKLEPEPPKLARFHSPHGFRVQRLPDAGQGSCSGKGRCAGAAASGIYISVAAGLRGRWVRGALVCPLGSPSGGLKATVTWGTRGKGQKR